MDEIIRINEQFYILATSALPHSGTRVLKHGNTFAVFDRSGDIESMGRGEQGIFHEDTRFLSRMIFRIGQARPLLLSAGEKENSVLTVDLSNHDVREESQVVIPRGSLHIARSKFLWRATCYEEFQISNYSLSTLELPLVIQFEADFADIFEVRGTKRERKGWRLQDEIDTNSIVLSYEGLDSVIRRTRIQCSPAPTRISASELQFKVSLKPRAKTEFHISIGCEIAETKYPALPYGTALAEAATELHTLRSESCSLFSSNQHLNNWVSRSLVDLDMMMVGNPEPHYPYAGVPWFSTVFGRDGIITALECLWMNPLMARGVLEFLAETQAESYNPDAHAEPGKIVHETRHGEMAALGEIPFGCYYGSVDSTPLFLMLAGAYYERTADLAFIEALWPNIQMALDWIDHYGDVDGDGYVEYVCRTGKGLMNQGWKDSNDSIFHADGTLADGPIALCEVQGYVYAGKRYAAKMAAALDKRDLADALEQQAAALQESFERDFWCEDLETYALALDGTKRPCRVRTSNAGHLLYSEIASPERALAVKNVLMSADSFSGWGIRTVARGEARYNPMSYHNGSVWPHDNSIIASGFAKYGFKDEAIKVMMALLDASVFLDLHRLPELFCGFPRRHNEGPTLYPVACSPQAWSAGCAYSLLGSCLGISIEARNRQIVFRQPRLPESISHLLIKNLSVDGASVEVSLEHKGEDVAVRVSQREHDVAVALRK